MKELEVFLKQLAEREEEFGDFAMYEFITNKLLGSLHHPKHLADMFYDFYDARR